MTDIPKAHGTGTKAGDPLEANAIGSVFAPGRNKPLVVGSIKSCMGHLEGASGLAGVIKASLSVEKGKILPNMHFETPNPNIDFEDLKITVPTKVMDWNSENGVRRASINSFGYGGSNAHVILENYRQRPRALLQNKHAKLTHSVQRPYLIPLTSHNEEAGKLQVSKFSDYIQQHPHLNTADLSYSLSLRRSMHRYRSFVIGNDNDSVLKELSNPRPVARWTRSMDESPRLGFIFTGQGAQWHAMGRQLIEQSDLFRQTLEKCDAILQSLPDSPDWSCIGELSKSAETSRLAQSEFSQPLCAALQLGIVDLLHAWGIEPSGVIGHSSGEIVAAYAAGCLSFENSILCAYYRGLYMSKGSGSTASVRGAMMAVGLGELEGRAELKPYEGRIALAAINSPSSLTFSGDEDAIVELKENLESRKVFVRQLKVEQAFHSHHMVPLSPAFEAALARTHGFRSEDANVKFSSSVTARDSSARKVDAAYWAANMTGVVRYSDALTNLLLDDNDEKNVDVVLEIGAHPALKGPSNQLMKALNLTVPYIASLTREAPALDALLSMAGQLFALGYPVDLGKVNSMLSIDRQGNTTQVALGKQLHDLPTYAWKHGKFWAETRLIRENRLRSERHTLLGAPIPGGLGNYSRWRNYLRKAEIPWLQQHVVDGKVIFPAAGYISMAMEALITLTPSFKNIHLRDVVVIAALEIGDTDAGTEVITELQPLPTSAKNSSSTWFRFVLCSFDQNYKTIEHCHGLICAERGAPAALGTLDEASDGYTQTKKRTNRCRQPAPYYETLRKMGIDYHDDFQLLSGDIESGPGFAMAPITFKPANVIERPADTCALHPTFLDSSFHAIFAAIETTQNGNTLDETFIPTFIRSMKVSGLFNERRFESEDQHFWVKNQTVLPGARTAINHLTVQSELSNEVLLEAQGFEVTALGNVSMVDQAKRHLFFRIKWLPAFDHLGKNGHQPYFDSIADVLDVFVHQYPDRKILHLTSGVDSSKEALRLLGGRDDQPRRFQSFTPFSQSESFLESRKQLASEWVGRIDLEEPIENDYDVVVVSENVDYDVTIYLKDDGFVIVDGTDFKSDGLVDGFKAGKYSSYQKTKPEKTPMDNLALVVAPKMSSTTKALASAIESLYPNKVTRVTITDVLEAPPTSQHIISLVSLDEDIFFESSPEESDRYDAVKELLKNNGKTVLWMTNGVSHESSNPGQAIMVGLARTIRSEDDRIRLLTLDLPFKYDISNSSKRAVELLNSEFTEDEFAERDSVLQIPRIEIDNALNKKLPNGGHRQPRLEPFRQNRNLALKIGRVGLLDSLVFEDDEYSMDPHIADDDVEIEVRASALNFRDIAASMGIIDDYRLGDECAGIVKRTGRNVKESDLKPGDRVLALRPGQGAHRTVVRNPAIMCQKIEDMDFATATSFGCILATAYYSLIDSARLQPGEYCLIHSAAGGVGQMAIQVAQMVGAKIIVTVGSQGKRDFLKKNFGLQDDMIFNSRDASFVENVMRVTNGRGCDVALNQLAGELLHATWSCIAPFGRLVEIGKRDIHENTKLDMEPFRKAVSYAAVDLITLFELNKPVLSRLMRECYYLIRDGKIKAPTPITQVSYAEAQKGFRLLQMGKVFGKVVLVPGEKDLVPVTPPAFRNNKLFDPAKTYLLVGGLGGIGRTLSEWMFRRGARKLAFLSRSGAKRSDAKETVEWLKARNVGVEVFAGDVANFDHVQNCVKSLGETLAGVFQAAMVLRDLPFSDMTLEQWQTCVAPKVRGTHNLHKATIESNLTLDFFVGFSSASAIVGAKGQANYAAANVYIDSLMCHRRQNGLAGSTMNVGMVSGIGAVAEDAALQKIMERIGYEAINEQELFYQIEEAVTAFSQPTRSDREFDNHQSITGLNLARKDLYWAEKPLFRNIYANLDLGISTSSGQGTFNLIKELQNAENAEARTVLLMDAFIEKIATVLSVPASSIQTSNPLSAYGLDSIVAVEFRKWFNKTLAIEVSLFDILGAKSIEALVNKVSAEIVSTVAEAPIDTPRVKMAEDTSLPEEEAHEITIKSLVDEVQAMERPAQVPLSSFQSRIWFLHNLLDDPSALNFAIVNHIKGRPDLRLMQEAMIETARRNDMLRTKYLEGEQFSEQEVVEQIPLQVQSLDVSSDPRPERALQRCVEDLRSTPLDIEEGEMVRFTLVKLAEERYAVVLIIHHISLDNGSTKSFMDQFNGLYEALRTEKDLSLIASPPMSYSDFTLWHDKRLKSAGLGDDIKWWAEKFNGAVGANSLLPFAKSQRPAKRSSARSIMKHTLDLSILKRLKRVCARTNATPFQFLLTAFRAFIHRYTQEDDLTILMIDGNRPHPELEDVVGFFVNMIPLRCQNDCDKSFEELLGEVKETALEGLAHSQVPFDAIVDAAGVDQNASHFPLGQVIVNYQIYGKPPQYKNTDYTITNVDIEDIPTAAEMQLEATEDPTKGLYLRFEYDSLLYGATDMERFFENFSTFMSSIVRDHLQPVNEVAMCGSKELAYLEANCWAGKAQRNDWQDESILGKIMGFAETQPQATAVVTSDGKKLTYAEVVVEAQKIATMLAKTGVSSGQFVGILSHPGLDMITAMLGIVYMGCAYVPLDPKFAQGRLVHMIEDSSASVILTGDGTDPLVAELKASHGLSSQTIPVSSASSGSNLISPTLSSATDPLYVIYTSVSIASSCIMSPANTLFPG